MKLWLVFTVKETAVVGAVPAANKSAAATLAWSVPASERSIINALLAAIALPAAVPSPELAVKSKIVVASWAVAVE